MLPAALPLVTKSYKKAGLMSGKELDAPLLMRRLDEWMGF
jgi:hypothetical protein